MYIGRHVKYLLFLSDFNETLIFSTDFWKILKFNENPFSGRQVPCGQIDMAKLSVAFCNVANVPKKTVLCNVQNF